jgi:hypothetical protein
MDGTLQLYPLWPALRSDMLLSVVYPQAPLPHYISVGQLSSFISGGGISLPLSIEQGGTASTSAAAARDALGAAPLTSPTFLGEPSAPTALPADNSTRLATTAFVRTAAGAPSWDNITNKPATFPPTLPIPESGVTNLVGDLAAKAPLASPALTGTPTAPTAGTADTSAQLATTAFVKAAIAGGASLTIADIPPTATAGALWWDSSSGQLFVGYNDGSSTQWVAAVNQPGATGATGPAGATGPNWTVSTGLTLTGSTLSLTSPVAIANGGTNSTSAAAALTALGAAPLASPSFTGTPSLPTGTTGVTQAAATSNTSLATTAYVKAQGPYLPLTGGTLSGTLAVGGNANPSLTGDAAWTTILAPDGLTNARCIALGTVAIGDATVYRTTAHHIQSGSGGTTYARFDNGGSYNVSGSWLTLSDARLKEDVADYGRGLAEICGLRPVKFRYRGSPFHPDGAESFGLVAQDVEPLFPELVSEYVHEPPALPGEEPAEPATMLALDYNRLIFALVNAVRELAAKVEELEARPGGGTVPV